MGDKLILLLFLGLIFGVIGGILYVLLIKHLKGEIKIHLIKRNYNFGETIQGSFKLHAKKEIIANELMLHLVAYKRETTYGKDGKRHTRKIVFVKQSQHIESDITYEAGVKKEFTIKIDIPTRDKIFGAQSELDLGDGTLGKLAKFALHNTKRTQLTWQIQVDLDATGLDLQAKKDIFLTE